MQALSCLSALLIVQDVQRGTQNLKIIALPGPLA